MRKDVKDVHLVDGLRVNKIMLPIIRNTFPNTVKEKLFSVQPDDITHDPYCKPYEEIVIQGGLYHDYLNGFGFKPYELVKQKVQIPEDTSEHIYYIKTILNNEILDTAQDDEELEIKRRLLWDSLINE
jgi:hypothetical protein